MSCDFLSHKTFKGFVTSQKTVCGPQ